VMVVMLERFAHKDALLRVQMARKAKGLDAQSPATAKELQRALETYVTSYMLGPKKASRMSPRVVSKLETYNMTYLYPAWQSTQDFIAEVRQAWVADAPSISGKVESPQPFSAVEHAVEELNERFGQFQDRECKNLKQQLLTLEDPDCPGYVPLSRFYNSALNRGKWQFTESVAYLRDSGALLEQSGSPSVLVANYLAGPSNCVASSNFHTLCCMDECEELLASLEGQLGMPDAEPAAILPLVAALPSSSEPVREALSTPLVQRLEQIAEMHDGRVPLHSRLFAQWMHSAYPRDCQYPHLANSTRPLGALEWKKATGKNLQASQEEMHLDTSAARAWTRPVNQLAAGLIHDGHNNVAPQCPGWSWAEELVVPVQSDATVVQSMAWAASRPTTLVVPAGALCVIASLTLLRLLRPRAGDDIVQC